MSAGAADYLDKEGNSLADLILGDHVLVPYGARAKSKARFLRWTADKDGKPLAVLQRHIVKTDSWTKEMNIYPRFVFGRIPMTRQAA